MEYPIHLTSSALSPWESSVAPVHTRHLMHQQILILHTQHIGATLFSHLTVSIGSSQLPCFQACPVMLCSPYSRVIRAIRGIFKITRLTYSMLTLPMFRDYPIIFMHHNLLKQFPTARHLGCFLFFLLRDNASVLNMEMVFQPPPHKRRLPLTASLSPFCILTLVPHCFSL